MFTSPALSFLNSITILYLAFHYVPFLFMRQMFSASLPRCSLDCNWCVQGCVKVDHVIKVLATDVFFLFCLGDCVSFPLLLIFTGLKYCIGTQTAFLSFVLISNLPTPCLSSRVPFEFLLFFYIRRKLTILVPWIRVFDSALFSFECTSLNVFYFKCVCWTLIR